MGDQREDGGGGALEQIQQGEGERACPPTLPLQIEVLRRK